MDDEIIYINENKIDQPNVVIERNEIIVLKRYSIPRFPMRKIGMVNKEIKVNERNQMNYGKKVNERNRVNKGIKTNEMNKDKRNKPSE